MDRETADPSRRSLLAALAGGLALAVPARAVGKKRKPKPPQAFAVVVVTETLALNLNGAAGFELTWETSFFAADGREGRNPLPKKSFVPLGEDARATIAADVRADAAAALGIPSASRVAVEIL